MKANIILIIGFILILLGSLFLGPTLGLFSLGKMWPSIILLIGIGLLLGYIVYPKVYGLLMPAAILIFSSIPFFICSFSGEWTRMVTLWPIFIISVAIGFLLMYFLGNKHKGLLIPGLIIIGVGIITYLIFNYVKFLFPILFFAAGLTLIFIGLTSAKKKTALQATENIPETKTND